MSALPPKADIAGRGRMSALYQKSTSYPPHGARAAIPDRPTVAVVAGRWLLLPGVPMK
jgi:hypothetical protein